MKNYLQHRQFLCPVIGLLLYLMLYGNASAQSTITLKGTVKDSEAPISGVTVWEKNTNNGTLTDQNGKYSLQISLGSIVTSNFIGYTNLVPVVLLKERRLTI
ncbi:carboxypeptidase-like regulatory domain-containing protein [Gelidibacter japonicus]|uniref:carboxypeptidase-like regulatory domain-containing protein n=1 Tax=Gelidibacter japonicus TaxID=1962232 RepID=UPI003A9296CB